MSRKTLITELAEKVETSESKKRRQLKIYFDNEENKSALAIGQYLNKFGQAEARGMVIRTLEARFLPFAIAQYAPKMQEEEKFKDVISTCLADLQGYAATLRTHFKLPDSALKSNKNSSALILPKNIAENQNTQLKLFFSGTDETIIGILIRYIQESATATDNNIRVMQTLEARFLALALARYIPKISTEDLHAVAARCLGALASYSDAICLRFLPSFMHNKRGEL